MNDGLIARLNAVSENLQRRAKELERSDQESDVALLMHGLAITIEAVNAIGLAVNRVDGPAGLGGGGE